MKKKMHIEEVYCTKCKELLSATKQNLICPDCEDWIDVTNKNISKLKLAIETNLKEASELAKKISYYQIFPSYVNFMENIAKEILTKPHDIGYQIKLIEDWVKFSIISSIAVKKTKTFQHPDFETYFTFEEIIKVFNSIGKNFIQLLKLENKQLKIYQAREEVFEITSPNRPLVFTPLKTLEEQYLNADPNFEYSDDFFNMQKTIQSLQSSVDSYLFPEYYYRLLGSYLINALGLPEFLFSSKQDIAKNYLHIMDLLKEKMKTVKFENTPAFTEIEFIKIFGKEFHQDIQPFINRGGFKFKENAKWKPNVFLQDKGRKDLPIFPLPFSNTIIRNIVNLKFSKVIGSIFKEKGIFFEDWIFENIETINVSGSFKNQKLVRIPNPIKDDRMKELADVIFLGETSGKTYIVSAKSRPIETFQNLIRELRKYKKEQELIMKGVIELGVPIKKVEWIFVIPITWIAKYENILIFNLQQLLLYLLKKEGARKISLQTQEETMNIQDFKEYGIKKIGNRRMNFELVKIHNIKENEVALWIPTPGLEWGLILVDIPDFLDISFLEKEMWINIVMEYRTKLSTSVISYHDSKILNEEEACEILLKRGITPLFP